MGRVPITVLGYRCERCEHEWIPRGEEAPQVCPKCKSPYWDRPRASATTYEAFRDRVRAALQGSDVPMTWTEIRTAAKLPQALPNNQWVRRLESDISLIRERDKHGIIKWKLKQGG